MTLPTLLRLNTSEGIKAVIPDNVVKIETTTNGASAITLAEVPPFRSANPAGGYSPRTIEATETAHEIGKKLAVPGSAFFMFGDEKTATVLNTSRMTNIEDVKDPHNPGVLALIRLDTTPKGYPGSTAQTFPLTCTADVLLDAMEKGQNISIMRPGVANTTNRAVVKPPSHTP